MTNTAFIIAAGLSVSLLTGCMSAPRKAYTVQQPRTAPIRNLTSMDLALSCLDRQLLEHHARPLKLTSTGLPNRAGDKVGMSSGTDMLKTSIGQLAKSNVYAYIDLASLANSMGTASPEPAFRPLDQGAIFGWAEFLKKNHADFRFPDYIITGSISQADNNVTSDQVSGGLDAGGADAQGGLGASANQGVSVVTVDMQIEDAATLEIRNGLTTRNSIAVTRNRTGVDLSGRVNALGGHFDVSLDRSEGMHQAIRILIQLGTVELLGRLAGVPYEQCLTGRTVQAGAVGEAQDDFEGMSERERVRFAQQRLSIMTVPGGGPFYSGPVDGEPSLALRAAIAAYQRDYGLTPSGQADLDFYRSLRHRADLPPSSRPVSIPPPPPPAPPRLSFATPSGQAIGGGMEFPLHSTLRFLVGVDRDAYVECFLLNQERKAYRIFPTAEQPENRLSGGADLAVPDPGAYTQIRLDDPSSEEVACVAADAPLRAGAALGKGPLGTTSLPMSSLQEVLEHYRREAGGAVLGWESWRFRVK